MIRLRTLALSESTPTAQQRRSGEFDKMGEVATAKELLLFQENLNGIESSVKSDHVLNLFSEVGGRLPRDKEKMTSTVGRFLQLSPVQQMLFSIGRRMHRMSMLSDLDDPFKVGYAE